MRPPWPSPVDAPATARADWANILASLDDAVVVADPAQQVTFVNQAAESLTGMSAGQIRGRHVNDLFPEDRWLTDMIRDALASVHGRRRTEGTISTSTQGAVPVAVTVSPILDAHGAVEGAVGVVRDIRYRKDLEELSRHADRLASLELLSAGLAHEIKNPLGAIKGAAQLLQRHAAASGEGRAEPIAVIVREVDRLARLLDELDDLTQPAPLHFGPVNIHKVLHTVIELAHQRPEWSATVLHSQFDPSLPEIRANESKLVQVFLNLTINALQAMDGHGTLTISTRLVTDYHIRGARGLRGRFLSVDIEDTGPGIAAADAASIFAPFFTTKPSGSGLGLAICQQIVNQHDGRLWVRNRRRGTGALARVMLPVAVAVRQP